MPGMRRREFISAARRRGGGVAARGARRNGPENCRQSDSWVLPRLRPGSRGWLPLCSGCANLAGSRVRQSRSSIAGRKAAASASTRSRPSSFGSRSMLLSREESPFRRQNAPPRLIPIVFALAPDPVGSGLVASLARPGGNVTGLSNQSGDLFDKRLEILREVIPGLRRLAIIANRDNPQAALEIGDAQDEARKLGLDVTISEIGRADDIAPAIEALKGHADSSMSYPTPSRIPTGFGSTPSRSPHECRRCTLTGSTSKREV